MKFLIITLIIHAPDPVTGEQESTFDRFASVINSAVLLGLLDPVRAYEDYATLDHLSGGRLELMIGKGNGAAQRELFSVTPEDQWERNAESYKLFGHSVMHLHADGGGLSHQQNRDSLELFQSDIAPVLRRSIPDPPWGSRVPDSPERQALRSPDLMASQRTL